MSVVQQTRRQISLFVKWWLTTLRGILDDLLARSAAHWKRPSLVFVDKDIVQLFDGEGEPHSPAAQMPRADLLKASSVELEETLRRLQVRSRHARLQIHSALAFHAQLKMPLAAAPYLKSAVNLRLPALMPINVSELAIDFRVVSTDVEGGFLIVEAAAIRRVLLDECFTAIKKWGFRARRLEIAAGAGSPGLFRIDAQAHSVEHSPEPKINHRLRLGAIALAAACIFIGTTESYRAELSLRKLERANAPLVAAALSHRNQLSAQAEPIRQLEVQRRSPDAAQVLAAVTLLVPSDAWLTTFELKGSVLRLVGIAPEPAALVKRLASSTLLSKVELRSSISVGIGTGKDRFEILADLKDAGT